MTKKNNEKNLIDVVSIKMVREPSYVDYNQITSHYDVAELLTPFMKDECVEVCFLVGLDNRNQVSVVSKISSGSIASCPLPVSSVAKILLLANCSSFLVCHNHTSNYMVASENDLQITRNLKEALALFDIEMLDHVIVSSDMVQSLSIRQQHSSIWL